MCIRDRSLTEMMVGEKVKLDINRTEPVGAEKRIEMRGITCKNKEGLKVCLLYTSNTFVLIFKKVWNVVFVLLFSKTTLTAVAGNILTVAGEAVDG